MTLKFSACALAIAGMALSLPALAQAQDYSQQPGYQSAPSNSYHHRHRYRHYRTCGAERRARANNGTAIGAVSGGVLGAALGGGKVGNTLLGAGAGAVAGHEIGRHSARC